MIIYTDERIGLFIDGATLHNTLKLLNLELDYRKVLDYFSKGGRLIRANYYTAMWDDQDYSALRPLVDWLDYNGFNVVKKPAREQFDAAIVVEIGLAGDIPGVGENALPLRLGGGPGLVHKDALVHYDHALTSALEQAAARADISIQHAVFGSFGSDGVSFMRADIPSAMVVFPARYTHTPFETGHLDDIELLTEWMCAFVRKGLASGE